MATKKLSILHLDTEKSWRGGQQQVFYLHRGLVSKGIKSFLVSNSNSEIIKRCKENNLPHIELHMFGELDIIAAFKLSRICKKNQINIIQAHSAHALTIAILTKLFVHSVILIGVRRVDFSIGRNIFSKYKYKNYRVDSIICISDFIKEVLINDGVQIDKLRTVRSGADILKFEKYSRSENFRKKLGIKQSDILLGTVAAFAGHKDYPNLLNAFKIVKSENSNVKLILVGDGPLEKQIRELVSELEIENDIIFSGFIENVGEYLKNFDIFILASKKEGLGTSIIDALSCGLPIITTNTGGIPELIQSNKNGILVEPKNHVDLARAILDLISNPQRQKLLSKTAKESSNKFSIDVTVNKNIEEYKRLFSEIVNE